MLSRFNIEILKSVLPLLLAAALACAPPPALTDAQPASTPNIEATVEAVVDERLQAALADLSREELAAAPIPGATLGQTPAPLPAGKAAPDLAAMVEQAKAAVVRIETRSGGGTGFIFEADQRGRGLVLTNYHVIHRANRLRALVADSQRYQAEVLGYDTVRDLAVLEICCGDFQALTFRNSEEVRPGSEVVAIGYALGFSGSASVTRGIVSATRYHPAYRSWVFQTDAPMNPGNSGGPLLLATGQVIGINTFVRTRDRQGNPTEGLGFAISERSIMSVLPSLVEGRQISSATPTPAPAPSAPDPNSFPVVDWRDYRSEEHGYQVRVPRDWAEREEPGGEVSFTSADGYAGAIVTVYGRAAGSIGQLLAGVVEERREGYPGQFQLLSRQTFSRQDGAVLGYLIYRAQAAPEACRQQNTELLVYEPEGSYGLLFWVCRHAYQQYQPIQRGILDSFATPQG